MCCRNFVPWFGLTLWYELLQPLQNWYRHWEQLKCMQPPLVRAYWNLQ